MVISHCCFLQKPLKGEAAKLGSFTKEEFVGMCWGDTHTGKMLLLKDLKVIKVTDVKVNFVDTYTCT